MRTSIKHYYNINPEGDVNYKKRKRILETQQTTIGSQASWKSRVQ